MCTRASRFEVDDGYKKVFLKDIGYREREGEKERERERGDGGEIC